MSYTPDDAGVLTIYLKALNALHAQNITKHILVQHLLTSAGLYVAPQDTFINKTVVMKVYVMPRNSPVECLWDFGDGSTPAHTNNTSAHYVYRYPGHYGVKVCCSELHHSMHSIVFTVLYFCFDCGYRCFVWRFDGFCGSNSLYFSLPGELQ